MPGKICCRKTQAKNHRATAHHIITLTIILLFAIPPCTTAVSSASSEAMPSLSSGYSPLSEAIADAYDTCLQSSKKIDDNPDTVTTTRYWTNKEIFAGESVIVVDSAVFLKGNLTVHHGGFLWMENTRFILDSPYPDNFITIGGTYMLTSGSSVEVAANGTGYKWVFEPQSKGIITDCYINGLTSSPLTLMSDDVDVRNVTFRSTELMFINATADISGSRFEYAYRAITARNSTLCIENTTILNAYRGISAKNSTVVLKNSTLSSLSGIIPDSHEMLLNGSAARLLNTSLTHESVLLEDTISQIQIEWFLSIYVNSTNGPLAGATVNLTPSESINGTEYTTGQTGWIRHINVTEYIIQKDTNGTSNRKLLRNLYVLIVHMDGYTSHYSELNVTGNIVQIILLVQKYGAGWSFKNGDWTVNTTETFSDTTILLTGNLSIENGGTLLLNNATLIINCTSNGTFGIYVKNGSSLRITRSFIRPYDPSTRYIFKFEKGSSGRIDKSVIERVGYAGGISNGFEIDGGIVEMYASELRYNRYGLCVSNVTLPLIVSMNIHNNDMDGIRLNNASAAMIAGAVHTNGQSGLNCANASLSITETAIYRNGNAPCSALNSSFFIRNTVVYGNNASFFIDNTTSTFTDIKVFRQKGAIRALNSEISIYLSKVNDTAFGVEFVNSNYTLSSNTFEKINITVIDARNSAGEIDRCDIRGAGVGIKTTKSSASISNCTISDIAYDAISINGMKPNAPNDRFIRLVANRISNATGSGIGIHQYRDSSSIGDETCAILTGNNIDGCNYGVLCEASDITMFNNTLNGNKWYGLYSKDCIINSTQDSYYQSDYDLYLTEKSVVDLCNDTYSYARVFNDMTSRLTVRWHVWVTVRDKHGTPAGMSAVFIRNRADENAVVNGTTNANGLAGRFICIEFIKTGAMVVLYNPYNITAKSEWNGIHTSSVDVQIATSSHIEVYIKTLDFPPVPVNLEVPSYITESSVYLQWSQPSDIDLENRTIIYGYLVSGVNLDDVTPVIIINSTQTSNALVTGLLDNTVYFFRVRVIDKVGQKADSNEVSAKTKSAPPAPVTVSARYTAYDRINITWTASTASDFMKYEVHYSVIYNFSSYFIGGIYFNQNLTEATITGLEENTLYFIRVRTFDSEHGEFMTSYSDSNTVSATTGIKNSKPSLLAPKALPVRGYTTSIFNLSVVYVDIDNDDPQRVGSSGYIRANVSGFLYDMVETEPADKNFSDGKKYHLLIPNPYAGTYDFYFECNDGAERYNMTARTDTYRFVVETPRQMLFADMAYVIILLSLIATVFVLIFLLWREKGRTHRTAYGGSGRLSRFFGIPGSLIEDKKKANMRKESMLKRGEYAQRGIPDGMLKPKSHYKNDNAARIPDAQSGQKTNPPTQSAGVVSDTKAAVPEPMKERYCGNCGAAIRVKVCGFCGASQRKYLYPDRETASIRLIMFLLMASPFVVWSAAAMFVIIKGTDYFYPGHTLRLIAFIMLISSAFVSLYIGHKVKVRVGQIKKYNNIRCHGCGRKISIRSRYCVHCGRNVTLLAYLLHT